MDAPEIQGVLIALIVIFALTSTILGYNVYKVVTGASFMIHVRCFFCFVFS